MTARTGIAREARSLGESDLGRMIWLEDREAWDTITGITLGIRTAPDPHVYTSLEQAHTYVDVRTRVTSLHLTPADTVQIRGRDE